jgi:L-rhamnose mutarotase
MIRVAFLLGLRPGARDEYVAHHAALPDRWPDVAAEIARSGIASISIFEVDPEHLILVSEASDEAAWERFWDSEAFARWDLVMQPLMHYDANGRVAASPVAEVWRFESA